MRRYSIPGRLLATLLSLVLPGLGQLWQQRTMRGAFFVGLWLMCWLIPLTVVHLSQIWVCALLFGFTGHLIAAIDAAIAGPNAPRPQRNPDRPYLP